jgi:uncharacterized protein YeaO (DUF488 family)
MAITLQRIYDKKKGGGYRVLVDRLWPRGISKEAAALDAWWKELAPSGALRKWFDHDPGRWGQFRVEYRRELAGNKETARALLREAGRKNIVLLYGAKDETHCHALILKSWLEKLGA